MPINIFEFCEMRFRNRVIIINLVYFIKIYFSLLFECIANLEIFAALDGNLLIRKDENQTLENIKEGKMQLIPLK